MNRLWPMLWNKLLYVQSPFKFVFCHHAFSLPFPLHCPCSKICKQICEQMLNPTHHACAFTRFLSTVCFFFLLYASTFQLLNQWDVVVNSYCTEQYVRQCHPGRSGVSKSSCLIFFEEQSKSALMFIWNNPRDLDFRKLHWGFCIHLWECLQSEEKWQWQCLLQRAVLKRHDIRQGSGLVFHVLFHPIFVAEVTL